MKNWKKFTFVAIIAIFGIIIGFMACDKDNGTTHTHEWEWVVTTPATTEADGIETETCITCGQINGTRPIQKLLLLCTCNPKEHYLPCTCGGEDCTCKVIPRGYISEYETNVQIPLYQTVGVIDTKAETATANIIAAYNSLATGKKQDIKGKIKEIRIVSYDGVNYSDFSDVSGFMEKVYNQWIINFYYQYDKDWGDDYITHPEYYYADIFWDIIGPAIK